MRSGGTQTHTQTQAHILKHHIVREFVLLHLYIYTKPPSKNVYGYSGKGDGE